MNKLHSCGIWAALGFAGLVIAQEPETPGTVNPAPSTSQTEGTAADRTPPGETPTRDIGDPRVDPAPSTSRTEGTAADRTPPGETWTRNETTQANDLVGTEVVTRADARLGSVVDVVFDSKGQPSFVVIQSEGNTAAVPYSAATSMMSGDKVVIDQSKLERAPQVKQGEWRDTKDSTWKHEASRYWEQG